MLIEDPTHELEYRCIGIIHGKFIASDESDLGNKGYIKTPDGAEIPAHIINRTLLKFLHENSDQMDQEQYWTVFVKTQPRFQVQIKHLKNNFETLPEEDIFSIRGQIKFINYENKHFDIEIKRNIKVPAGKERDAKYKPFNVRIYGELPEDANRYQFWDMDVVREGDKLVFKSGQLIKVFTPPARKPRGNYRRDDSRGPRGRDNRNGNGPPRPSNRFQRPTAIKRRDMRSS